MSLLRFKMVDAAINHTAVEVKAPEGRPSDYFGEKVFGREAMRKYLDKKTYAALLDTMEHRTPLTREIADSIAAGMRQWALEHGADHYTHWFQPLTGGTAEKHDCLRRARTAAAACWKSSRASCWCSRSPTLRRSPTAASAIRSRPAAIRPGTPRRPPSSSTTTLCIPTVFISYTGEALDYKAAAAAVADGRGQGRRGGVSLFRSGTCKKVFAYLGWEQEYFLVDESLWAAASRPDAHGPYAHGARKSAKNQQLEDHYFGAIPDARDGLHEGPRSTNA